MSEDLAERLSAIRVSDTQFKSKHLPLKAGNAAPIAFGGFCVGFAINAAIATVPEGRYPYSVLGQFLGPVMVEERITCQVSSHRETRTFSSREVRVFQVQNGKERMCLILLMDFRASDVALLEYCPRPAIEYSDADDCEATQQLEGRLLREGVITERDTKVYNQLFGPLQAVVESRHCPEGICGQNYMGIAKNVKTTQDDLDLTEKTSAEWVRCRSNGSFGNIGFMLDAGLTFLPLVHQHRDLTDAGACSTLEFAIRIWDDHPDMTKWHLYERKTNNGRGGLTYAEGRLWSRDRKTMVASMTQQCILRPKPDTRPKSLL